MKELTGLDRLEVGEGLYQYIRLGRAGVSAAALGRDSINVVDWLSYCERNK